MGYSSVDAMFLEMSTNGKQVMLPYLKTVVTGATSAAGRTHECMSNATSTGGALVLTGTPGTGLVKNATSAGAMSIGADVETSMTRHLMYMDLQSPGTTLGPGSIILTDILHVYPSCVMVTTPSTLSNHPTWTGTGDTRMSNAKGVQCSIVHTVASSAAGQITVTYKDQDNNTAVAQQGSMYGPVAATPAGCCMAATPAAATPGSPYVPLANGDYGISQVTSYTINSGVTGATSSFILHRPIAVLPLSGAANTLTAWDFSTGPIRLPRVYDGACLGIFLNTGGALTTGNVIMGHMVFGWA